MPILPPRRYSSREMARFEQIFDQGFQKGKPLEYEVWVDGLRVIDRTDDPEEITRAENYVDPASTREVRVKVFRSPNNNNNDTHVLLLDSPAGGGTLQGIDRKIEERIQREKERWDHQRLLERHDQLQEENQGLRAELESANEELETFRAKKLHLGNLDLLELGGMVLEGVVRRNPQILHRLPMGKALAEAVEADNERQGLAGLESQTAGEDTEAAFSRVEDETENPYLELLRQIERSFDQRDFVRMMEILDCCTQRPDLIPTLLELVRGEMNPQPQT